MLAVTSLFTIHLAFSSRNRASTYRAGRSIHCLKPRRYHYHKASAGEDYDKSVQAAVDKMKPIIGRAFVAKYVLVTELVCTRWIAKKHGILLFNMEHMENKKAIVELERPEMPDYFKVIGDRVSSSYR